MGPKVKEELNKYFYNLYAISSQRLKGFLTSKDQISPLQARRIEKIIDAQSPKKRRDGSDESEDEESKSHHNFLHLSNVQGVEEPMGYESE